VNDVDTFVADLRGRYSSGSLNDSAKSNRINAIRKAGGDVVVSFVGTHRGLRPR
jgi:hypothetical protein